VGPSSLIGGPGTVAIQYPAQPGRSVVYSEADLAGNASLQEHTGPRAQLGRELGRLMTILSDSDDEEERGKATEAAEKTIAKYFDLDLESRRQELDRVMQRAADMEEMLTKREAAKEELVDLQMKSLELEASGLGLVPTVRSLAEAARSHGYSAYGGGSMDEMMIYGPGVDLAEMMGNVEEDPRSSAGRALYAAFQNHRQAKSTEDAAETEAALREALADYFDADMEVRRAELEEIRTGLEKLEQAVEKRAEARDEIIQVELQLILNQANGLGFFGDSQWNEGESGSQFFPY
jgi:hypothetical protein